MASALGVGAQASSVITARSARPTGPGTRLEQGGAQVGRAGGSAGAGLAADRALHHLHVPVAPLLQALVQVDEPLGHCADGPASSR